MSAKLTAEIEECVRQNVTWQYLPVHLKQIMKNTPKDYDRYVFNYSQKNQLRYRGNLVRYVFRNEQRYYELLVEKSISCLNLFPYHLADIVTKGLRVTPFNYYLKVISLLLNNDKSYDTLPNFTAADCLRVLGIGRNEYLALVSDIKTNSSKLFRKPNPLNYLPKLPIQINIEPWWKVEVGYVLESDIKLVNVPERSLIDDLIDFGSQTAGKVDYFCVRSLYKKGLIYLDVPISGEDKICIPPLKNFVMNRVSGDYFENLLYKIFVSVDEQMTISELSQMLQINLDTVKHAISLFCRLGFAIRKPSQTDDQLTTTTTNTTTGITTTTTSANSYHTSWEQKKIDEQENRRLEVTPLNYHALLVNETNDGLTTQQNSRSNESPTRTFKIIPAPPVPQQQQQQQTPPPLSLEKKSDSSISPSKQLEILSNSNEYISSDGNTSDFSIISPGFDVSNTNSQNESSEMEEIAASSPIISTSPSLPSMTMLNTATTTAITQTTQHQHQPISPVSRSGKRVAFLFDSTLTAFLMMGNLSPGLKNHAVTMFEVGKLCDESIDSFLKELEKVSLLDAEGEGEVSRYFAHAVILRSTIIALRNVLAGGLDLLRLECLESLDYKTRDRLLEKKYKFIISAAPLTSAMMNMFPVPFFGQFFKSSDNSHIWSKLFYYHISGYGPPSLLLTKGTVLTTLPRIFLGYGKLLVTIVHTDSYVINSVNFKGLNDQLKNGCVLVQGYGIRNSADVRYEAFPFINSDTRTINWSKHKGVERLTEVLNLTNTCGYITFVNTGVPDIGCDMYDINVHLLKPKSRKDRKNSIILGNKNNIPPKKLDLIPSTIMPNSISTNSVNSLADHLQSPMDGSEIISFSSNNTPINNIHQKIYKTIALKSPDENHFAITPPSNLSPANIYRSDDCNELLAKELAKLEDNNSSDPEDDKSRGLISQSSIELPMDNDDQSSIDENYQKDFVGEQWTILDVHFGTPLFDVDCNTRICEYIVQNLATDDNLQLLSDANIEMNKKLMKFIAQCQYFEDDNPELAKIGKLIPQPRINLAFENGKISAWYRK